MSKDVRSRPRRLGHLGASQSRRPELFSFRATSRHDHASFVEVLPLSFKLVLLSFPFLPRKNSVRDVPKRVSLRKSVFDYIRRVQYDSGTFAWVSDFPWSTRRRKYAICTGVHWTFLASPWVGHLYSVRIGSLRGEDGDFSPILLRKLLVGLLPPSDESTHRARESSWTEKRGEKKAKQGEEPLS